MLDVTQFKDVFVTEVEEHIQKLNDNLLILEKNIKQKERGVELSELRQKAYVDLLNELMRSSHTLKSSSATMGYKKMAFLTHVLEDVFDYARNGMIEISIAMVNELFKSVDALESSVERIKKEDKEMDIDLHSQKIKELTGVVTEGVGKSVRGDDGAPVVEAKEDNFQENKIDKKVLTKKDKKTENTKEVVIEKISHIKVPVRRLDDLMDLTEELLIDRMQITNRVEEVLQRQETVADISRREAMLEIHPTIEHLNLLMSNLQFQVMQVRLVPVGQVFARFPRMIRDLSHQKDKEIELVLEGGDLEVDRTIVDKLSEPLVHLLRNAVDHGVEKTGKITLKAKREKDFVTIVVEDDGQGVNWKEVVSSALEKGIISNKQSEELLHTIDTQEADSWKKSVASLLYNPQLSTKKKVTETSGRGVGLSVVKKFMESIGGNIMLESPTTKDGGTRFVLELPLTLAIVNALLVRIQSSVFAIPFSSIERVVSITSDDIKSVADQDVAVIDGDHVPLVNLERIFNLDVQKDIKKEMFESYALKERKNEVTDQVEKKISNKEEKKKTQTVVLTRRGKEVAGIEVDELLNEQEIIVKPLPSILHGVKGFSGSTILGDGEVVLILDVVSLLSDSNQLVRI